MCFEQDWQRLFNIHKIQNNDHDSETLWNNKQRVAVAHVDCCLKMNMQFQCRCVLMLMIGCRRGPMMYSAPVGCPARSVKSVGWTTGSASCETVAKLGTWSTPLRRWCHHCMLLFELAAVILMHIHVCVIYQGGTLRLFADWCRLSTSN
jgi:hypothetical protein